MVIVFIQVAEETQAQEKKRSQSHNDNTPSPKKKKVKTYDVDLPDAPLDGMLSCTACFLIKCDNELF